MASAAMNRRRVIVLADNSRPVFRALNGRRVTSRPVGPDPNRDTVSSVQKTGVRPTREENVDLDISSRSPKR